MAKKEETVVKKTTSVTLKIGTSGRSTIFRGDGLPWIVDRTESAVEWLKAQGHKVTDIELVGEKPANWDTVFEIAPPVEETPAPSADPKEVVTAVDATTGAESAPVV